MQTKQRWQESVQVLIEAGKPRGSKTDENTQGTGIHYKTGNTKKTSDKIIKKQTKKQQLRIMTGVFSFYLANLVS